jgi:hypothetical protein
MWAGSSGGNSRNQVPDPGTRPTIDQRTPHPSQWGDGLPTTGFPAKTSHGSVNFASTVGICVNAGVQVGAAGSVSACILFDGDGVGHMFTVKDGGGPAVGANLQGGIILSTADRMEKMDGPQGYVSYEGGEGPTGGIEIDSGGDTTVQLVGGVGGNYAPPVIPGAVNGGISLNHVDRWGHGK